LFLVETLLDFNIDNCGREDLFHGIVLHGWVPREFWLKQWEEQAIIDCRLKNPLEGHRGLRFMMLA
jgi:hypothetical protein